MKVLALSGWKGSGKDFLASYLLQKYSTVRVSFADPLKDSVAEEFGVDRAGMDDPSKKELPLTNFPVCPQDAYSENIAKFLFKEFRDCDGKQPLSVSIKDGKAYSENWQQLYWTLRALCIFKGSNNRSVASNFWVQKAIQKIKNGTEELAVVTDLRYRSEVRQLEEAFGYDIVFVRINRFDSSPSSDPSERDLDGFGFDFYIDNTSTKDHAVMQLEEVLFQRGINLTSY